MPSKSSKEEEPVPCHTERSRCKDHKKRKRDIHAAIEEYSTSIKHAKQAKTEKNKKKKKNKDVVVLQVLNGHPVGSFELEDIIAGFLSSRGLHSTLSVFLSETQHEYTKTAHAAQLEDIYHHYLKRIYKNSKEQKADDVKFVEDTNFGKSVDTEFNKEDAKSEKTKRRFRKNDDAEVVPPIISSRRSEEDHHRSDKEFSTEAMNDFSGAQKIETKKAEKNSDMVTGTCKSKIKLLKASVESEQVSQFDEPVFESQKHEGKKKEVTLDERALTDNEEQISRKKSNKVKITPKKKLQSTESHNLHGKAAKVNIAQFSNDSDSLLDNAVSKKKKKMKLHAMRPRDDEELTFGKKSKKEKMMVGNSLSMESHAINKGSNERRLQDLCKRTRKSPDFEAQEEEKEENKSTKMTWKDHNKIIIHKKSKKKKNHCKNLQPQCPNPVNGAKEIREYLFQDCDSTQNISQAHMAVEANKSITSESVVSKNDSTVVVYKNGGAPVEQGGCEDTKAKVSLNLKDNQKESNTPKTAKSFQRVKVEEVKFSDPRLQDNSYWGKDGAENGYGAKAQEVLGQVKGKDFRHEKTKKKRGSYTGGMIDLQSYSTKFSYSDDE